MPYFLILQFFCKLRVHYIHYASIFVLKNVASSAYFISFWVGLHPSKNNALNYCRLYFPFSGDDCIFPETWHGSWFLQGEMTLVNVSKQDFGYKGFCYAKACDVCEVSSESSWEGPPKSEGSANDGKKYVIYNR